MIFMLSEINQEQKDKYFTYICKQNNTKNEQKEVQNRIVVANTKEEVGVLAEIKVAVSREQ